MKNGKQSRLKAIKNPIRYSIATRLFFCVLSGALVGLGGMACLFYQVLEDQAKTEIRSQLSTQAALVEGQLSETKQANLYGASAIQTLYGLGIRDTETYKKLAFSLYQNRPAISMAVGFSQPKPGQPLQYPYFAVDQHVPNQVGQGLPAPNQRTRYADLCLTEKCFEQDYYKLPTQTGKSLWMEPYLWHGITMTTFVTPLRSPQNQVLGMVGHDVNVTALSHQLNLPVIQNDGYFAIVSEKGNLLAYPPDLQKAERLETYQTVPQLKAVWSQLGKNSSGLVEAEGTYWFYQRIQGTNWLMIAVVSQSVVVKPVLLIAVGSALGAGVVLALVVSLFVRWLNRRLKPMLEECNKLVEADVERLDRLNLQTTDAAVQPQSQLRLRLQDGDELNTLEQSFHHMANQLQASFDELEQRVAERTEELTTTLEQLEQSQLQLVQSEKMSSLGQLVAGVAHEINNPVNFIHGNLSHLKHYADNLLGLTQLYQHHIPHPPAEIAAEITEMDFEFLQEDLAKALNSMQMGTDRIRDIVRSLRNFSRLDEAEVKNVDIHEGIDSTLLILQSRLTDRSGSKIQVIKDYGKLPLVECHAGQLNQVFMNILSNAIDALTERNPNSKFTQTPNTIRIWTGVSENQIAIRIVDNGVGMSEAVRSRIFDPFFTTKSIGKGTGLGLSISYQIVTQHGGQIGCESTPGQGTKFAIEIPIHTDETSITLRQFAEAQATA